MEINFIANDIVGERKARFLEGNKKALIAGMEAAR